MKSFAEYLTELLAIPNKERGLSRRRHTMPQLTNFDAFTKDIKSSGHSFRKTKVRAAGLAPTQSNFNEDKVKRMIDDGGWKKHPIITSSDSMVIDGHHRWLAACELDEDIECCVINMTAEKILDFCEGKSYIEKRKLHESALNEQVKES